MVVVHTVGEYLRRSEVRRNTPSALCDGLFTYLVNGVWIGEDEFNSLHPPVEYLPFNEKGVNPCRKHAFVTNTKSY